MEDMSFPIKWQNFILSNYNVFSNNSNTVPLISVTLITIVIELKHVADYYQSKINHTRTEEPRINRRVPSHWHSD